MDVPKETVQQDVTLLIIMYSLRLHVDKKLYQKLSQLISILITGGVNFLQVSLF
jgi:hypothetical protein